MSGTLREGLLFGMGNPLLDILAHADEKFLKRYGLKPNDAILAEEKHRPMYHEMIETLHVQYIAGGATQNSMRVAQWIIGKPNVTTFMGCVGDDKFGKILAEKAKEAGVNVQYQIHKTEATGTCGVVITENGANRSLCANLAAANCFSKDHLEKPENRTLIKNADFFYISGFFLTVSPESILEVAKYACEANKVFMMNLSAPFLSQFFKEPMMQAMPYVDILFGNESEAATFSKEQNLGLTSVKEIALKICEFPKENKLRSRMTIITQGSNPVIVACDGKVTEYPVINLKNEEIIDTNGAGDAFVGGFLAKYIQGKPIDVCVKCGVYAATEIIKQSGCQFPQEITFKEN
ncbi:adenosine kinase-like [Limulus polyphemus]|uniref:Adenosine kinase n=1 Tax=Limulus polyphemus TaxID=6850 RepID=A0ABM1T5L1_LIMPO|nr:adenosine kinase-like [Limulus polyphemus]